MLYVDIELSGGRRKVFGPYVSIVRGAYTEFSGEKPDGTFEDVYEVTVGRGGYCDTCAYEYTAIRVPGMHDPTNYSDMDDIDSATIRITSSKPRIT